MTLLPSYITIYITVGYVPDVFTPKQWKKKNQQEKNAMKNKKFGAYGPQGFTSRSMQSFQQDLEKGKTSHLMPVFNAKEKVKKGKLKQEDIPYMQRGGGWDNSDVKGAKKKEWSANDKKYNANQGPAVFDWSGAGARQSPASKQKAAAAKKAPPKKKFGLW